MAGTSERSEGGPYTVGEGGCCNTNALWGKEMCSLKLIMYKSSPRLVIVWGGESVASALLVWHWDTMWPMCFGSQPGVTAKVTWGGELLTLNSSCCEMFIWIGKAHPCGPTTHCKWSKEFRNASAKRFYSSDGLNAAVQQQCRRGLIADINEAHAGDVLAMFWIIVTVKVLSIWKFGKIQQYRQSTVDCINWTACIALSSGMVRNKPSGVHRMVARSLHNKSLPIKLIGLFSEIMKECCTSEPSTVTLDVFDIGSARGMPATPTVVTKLDVGMQTCSSDLTAERVAPLSTKISTVVLLTSTGIIGSCAGEAESRIVAACVKDGWSDSFPPWPP